VGEEHAAQIKLFIVSRNPALTSAEVITYCREALAAYKVPKLIEFRTTLPKSNVGKVLRRELRAELESPAAVSAALEPAMEQA